jgi:hypothetical protein
VTLTAVSLPALIAAYRIKTVASMRVPLDPALLRDLAVARLPFH